MLVTHWKLVENSKNIHVTAPHKTNLIRISRDRTRLSYFLKAL